MELIKISTEHWIQTNDDHIIIVDIKNRLPKSKLKHLLLTYFEKFTCNNRRNNPLKIGLSLAEINLLMKAHHALKKDIAEFNFTNEEQNTLLDMALSLKALDMYIALLGPYVPEKTHPGLLHVPEINQLIAQLLLQLDNSCKFQTPQEEFIQDVINQIIKLNDKKEAWNLPKNIQYTHDKKYYITSTKTEITIYDAITNKTIEKFKQKSAFNLFPTKNLVLIHPYAYGNSKKDEYLLVYDINKKTLHTLPSSPSADLLKTHINSNEDYIVGWNSNSIHLWNIDDLHNIIESEQPVDNVKSALFSQNNKFIISTAHKYGLYGTLHLWLIDNKKITLSDSLDTKGSIVPYFGKTNQKLITLNRLSRKTKQYLIQQDNNNYTITPLSAQLKNCTIPYDEYKINEPFFQHEQNNSLTFYSLSGSIIYSHQSKQPYEVKVSKNNKNIAIIDRWGAKKIDIIHLSDDATLLGTSSQQLPQINLTGPISITFNQNDSLILLRTPKIMILCDTYGNTIKEWYKKWSTKPSAKGKFHPLGNAIIGGKDLFHLFEPNTHSTLTTITQNLTIGQYALFKKISTKERKEDHYITIKEKSLAHHSLKTLPENEQKLITEQLYLKTTH